MFVRVSTLYAGAYTNYPWGHIDQI